MSSSILYISYTGLMEPLGQSQVLQYMLGLSDKHTIHLMTFEKPKALEDNQKVNALFEKCAEAGIHWTYLKWHSKPNLPATAYDVLLGIRKATKIACANKIQVVHCRSYIGGMIGLAVKKKTGAKFVFDMRGFWPDERVDGGVWSVKSKRYKFFKYMERKLFLGADHVVSLTQAGSDELSKFDYLQNALPPISVIPTCSNLEMFKPSPSPKTGFTLGYVGSIGTWYLFDDVAKVIARLFAIRNDARFLVINKGGHDRIRAALSKHNIDMDRIEIKQVAHSDVGSEISRMHAGIFFIKAAWSKNASCPTRMGEFLASGRPCIANVGVGDVEKDFKETGTGITLPVDSHGGVIISDIDQALNDLFTLADSPNIQEKCRKAAMERFSLHGGVQKYDEIYNRLTQTSR